MLSATPGASPAHGAFAEEPHAEDALAAGTLAVLYEDEHVLAVDKPAGLVTHPAYRHATGTLCDLVFARQAVRGERRPWLLHRLDRETSGLILFAKSDGARRALVRQFERRSIRKQYLAITSGIPPHMVGVIDAPLRRDPLDRRRVVIEPTGQPSVTRYQRLAVSGGLALVLAEPLTGRTHQIRAHLAWVGAPVLGDARYTPTEHAARSADVEAPRVMLHAWCMHLRMPLSGEPRTLRAPLPTDLVAILRRMGIERDRALNQTSDSPGGELATLLQELQEALCS